MLIVYLATFLFSLLLSFVLTKWVRDVANRRGWVTAPVLARHLHNRPLPRLGGIAIFVSFLASFTLALQFLPHRSGLASNISSRTIATILGSAALIFLLGVYDDLRSLGPWIKFAVQAVAASVLFGEGFVFLICPCCSRAVTSPGSSASRLPSYGCSQLPTHSILLTAWMAWRQDPRYFPLWWYSPLRW